MEIIECKFNISKGCIEMPCYWAALHFYEQMSMCSWAVMSGCSSAHRVWADAHVLMSSYERVLICSSRKFYQAYFNKIYSISSGLNGPYEQMSMCSWAFMSGCSSTHPVWADEHVLLSSYERVLICSSRMSISEHVLRSSYERVLICSSRKFYRAYFNKIYSSSSKFRQNYYMNTL
jgi:hypothetical protein